jgi:hypothetical protein
MWDKEKGEQLADTLAQFPNATFLDVGANIGLFSLVPSPWSSLRDRPDTAVM